MLHCYKKIQKGMFSMKKTNNISLVLSIIAASVSLAAMIIAVIALVKSFGKGRAAKEEYDFYDDPDLRKDYGDLSEDDDIGSDTLAF